MKFSGSCQDVWKDYNCWLKDLKSVMGETDFRNLTRSVFTEFFVLCVIKHGYVTGSTPFHWSMPVADALTCGESRQFATVLLCCDVLLGFQKLCCIKLLENYKTVTRFFFECNFGFGDFVLIQSEVNSDGYCIRSTFRHTLQFGRERDHFFCEK